MEFKNIEVKRNKRRKKISFEMSENGEIIIKAPEKCTDEYLEKLYEHNSKNILDKYNSMKEHMNIIKFEPDANIPYKGDQLKLKIVIGKSSFQVSNNILILTVSDFSNENIKESFIKFLRAETLKEVKYVISEYDSLFSGKINLVRVKKQEKRWGSCSSRGNINFNYDLILMDRDFIRYVVIHELCHLIEMNHSKKFWEKVEMLMPHYGKHKKIKKSFFY